MIRSKKILYNWANINRAPADEFGVYSFWRGNICLYVGKAKIQSLRKRLLQHYTNCHNASLSLWLNSSHNIHFQYDTVQNNDAIDTKERRLIRKLSPKTNKTYVN